MTGLAPSVQHRIEKSVVGRALISAFLLVTLVSIVVANLPQSKLTRDVLRVDQTFLNASGLEQNWSVFAPDPRRHSISLHARVLYSNGSERTWRIPRGGALIGSYWDYHWQKWVEFVIDDGHANLRRPAAEFIARETTRRGQRPVRVTLIRVISRNNPPGHGPSHQQKIASAYYSLGTTPTRPKGR